MSSTSPASAPELNLDELAKFRHLFSVARVVHFKLKKMTNADNSDHVAARQYAGARGWVWGVELLTALMLCCQGKNDEALQIATKIDVPQALRGDLAFLQGVARHAKKEYDEAIEAYRHALATPEYANSGEMWHNIGASYAAKKEHDQAIEAYRNAFATPGYLASGDVWNNLGHSFAEKKEYDQAIEAYGKALATPGYGWPRLTEVNLAYAYRAKSRPNDAEVLVLKVLSAPDSEGLHDRARLILSLIEADRKSIEIKPGEEALAAGSSTRFSDGPGSRMKALLTKRENRYETYLKNRPREVLPNDFTVLRGWGSAVTLLEGSQNSQWRGGGYLLHWRGHGVVIDPGFDFVDNLHDAGFHGTSIRAVVVSHNHPDHNYDLGGLDDLYYELHRREDSMQPALFVMDEDTGRLFPDNSPKHRGSACKMTRSDHERRRWQGGMKENLPFTIEHFPVFHGSDVPHALGLRFRLHAENPQEEDLVIGYTGDAKFTPELVEHLRGVDILIAHVSQPDEREFNDPEFLKDIHLGYNGVTKLVKEIKPKLTLVGEFWAGLADLRLDLVAGIRQRSGVPTVLPACLGLRLRLPEMTVRCTRCQKQTPADKLKVAPPIREFGELGYLCPECIL